MIFGAFFVVISSTLLSSTPNDSRQKDSLMNSTQFDLTKLQREQTGLWSEFLDVDSLSMGIYRVPAGTDDQDSHAAHDRDEIYVVLEGQGKLTVEEKHYDVSKQSILFVKAGCRHHFHDVEEDLVLLVFFAGEKKN